MGDAMIKYIFKCFDKHVNCYVFAVLAFGVSFGRSEQHGGWGRMGIGVECRTGGGSDGGIDKNRAA